jgi:hypothetical protein
VVAAELGAGLVVEVDEAGLGASARALELAGDLLEVADVGVEPAALPEEAPDLLGAVLDRAHQRRRQRPELHFERVDEASVGLRVGRVDDHEHRGAAAAHARHRPAQQARPDALRGQQLDEVLAKLQP